MGRDADHPLPRSVRVAKLEEKLGREFETVKKATVNLVKDIPREPYIYIDIGPRSLTALIDTGSSVTLIKSSIFDSIDKDMLLKRPSKTRVFDASGGIVNCLGSYYVRARLQGHQVMLPVIVVPDNMQFKQCILLGMDFMKVYNFEIRLDTNTVAFGKNRSVIPLTYGKGSPTSCNFVKVNRKTIPRLRLSQSILLAPGETKIARAHVRRAKEDTLLFSPYQHVEDFIDAGLIKTERNCECKILLGNDSLEFKEFRIGDVLGSLASVEVKELDQILEWGEHVRGTQADSSTSSPSDPAVRAAPSFTKHRDLHSNSDIRENMQENLKHYIQCDKQYKERLVTMLRKYRSAISLPHEPLGRTDLFELDLRVREGAKPIALPPYKIPHSKEPILKKEVKELLDQGVIEPARGPWSFPVILVPKQDGSMRLCVDYRKLNLLLEDDTFPLLNIQDIIMNLHGAYYYSKLDLRSAFHQIKLAEDSRPLTAFRVKDGAYQYTSCPFGLKILPSVFQRLMTRVFCKIKDSVRVEAYLDDIVVCSNSISQHLEDLEKVLECLAEAKLTIKPSKCLWFQKELEFLGYKISTSGYSPQEQKITAISQFPTPVSADKVRSFIGMMSYYRCFIKNFSKIASPLFALLKKDVKFKWEEEHQKTFETLKNILTSDITLVYPNFNQEFWAETDASLEGLGIMIGQKVDGKVRPIAFASRTLSPAEKNYSATELEALAVVWGLKKNRYILLGYKITVVVDHKPLIDLFKNTLPPGKLARWALIIQEYNPKFIYRPGKLNCVPDALSRNPVQEYSEVEELDVLLTGLDLPLGHSSQEETPAWTVEELRREQEEDEYFGKIYKEIVARGKNPVTGYQLRNMLLHYQDVYPDNHVRSGEVRTRVVVPKSLVTPLVDLYHRSACTGHPNGTDLIDRMSNRYVIQCLKDYVDDIDCHICNVRRRVNKQRAPLEKYPVVPEVFNQLHMDILGPLPVTKDGYRYIIVFVDRFTRFTILDKLRDRSAESVARSLIEKVFCVFTVPAVLLSDNAAEFISQIIDEICKSYQIRRCTITSYTPFANGIAESAVRRTLVVLRRLINPQQNNWDAYCPIIMKALNTSYLQSIGDTPHFLVFLKDPRHPFEMENTSMAVGNRGSYVASQLELRRKVSEVVKQNLEEEASKFTNRYNSRAKEPDLMLGNRVYIKKRDFRNSPKRKLADIYQGPYRIMKDLGKNRYSISHLEKPEQLVVHADNIKLVREPPVVKAKSSMIPATPSKHTNKHLVFPQKPSRGGHEASKRETTAETAQVSPKSAPNPALGEQIAGPSHVQESLQLERNQSSGYNLRKKERISYREQL